MMRGISTDLIDIYVDLEMEVVGRTMRNCCHRVACMWLVIMIILATSRFSFAVDQENVTVFQYSAEKYIGEYNTYAPNIVQLPNSDGEIVQLEESGVTCLGDFNSSGKYIQPYIKDRERAEKSQPNGNVPAAGRCLYRMPVQLLESPSASVRSRVTSFSTMFSVWMLQFDETNVSSGLAFIITDDDSKQGEAGGYLGWLNSTSNGRTSGRNFAVEVDFFRDAAFNDSDPVHVGVNINSLTSKNVTKVPVEQWVPSCSGRGSRITSGFPINVWIEYSGSTQILNVTVGTSNKMQKPTHPSISMPLDLTELFQERMFVGFSGSFAMRNRNSPPGAQWEDPSRGSYVSWYEIELWTFNTNGPAPDYLRNASTGDIMKITAAADKHKTAKSTIIASVTVPAAVVVFFLAYVIYVLQKRNSRLNALARKYQIAELEQLGRGPENFKYKVLSAATNGFNSTQLLGSGGFGSVYKGTGKLLKLRGTSSPTFVAIKRISAKSKQGAREFVAEVKIIGQVQHRNLVRLIGWCHERGELLLVYDYMPNGSLDQHLFKSSYKDNTDSAATAESDENVLTWARRLKVVSGVAMALVYLHEEWEQRVIHRDVKSSNVMLDSDFNARLGDFGLARLSDHTLAPTSTGLAGTLGYLAPELAHTFKATEKTDVYSFGALVLEVATGRRPLLPLADRRDPDEVLLVDWVWGLFKEGLILQAVDASLGGAYDRGEMVSLLKIGLWCSHPDPDERPSMREVLNIWKGTSAFPALPRTKPVPVFISDSTSTLTDQAIDEEANADSMHVESNGQFKPVNLDLVGANYTQKSFSTSEIRSRPWKSTPLPM